MNKLILIGRLTRDSEVRYSANNMVILRNTIAVDRRFKQDGQPTADFIPITAFNKTAEFIEKYFSKGSRIAIAGRIQTGSFEGADGNRVYTTDVVAEEVEFVESKRNDGQANPASYVPPQATTTTNDGFFPIEDDGDIPF